MTISTWTVRIHDGVCVAARAGNVRAYGATESEALANLGAKLARLGYHLSVTE